MTSKMSAAVAAVLLVTLSAHAQQAPTPAPNPLDVVPEKMPFAEPYGPPITLERANKLIEAAVAEATKRGWKMNVAVVDAGANLVAFVRMDDAQLASISIAQHKARTSAKYRRPTKAFEDAIQKSGFNYVMTLDDIVASRGGIPLSENGHIIGAIGCSGGTGSQDEVVCTAAAETIK